MPRLLGGMLLAGAAGGLPVRAESAPWFVDPQTPCLDAAGTRELEASLPAKLRDPRLWVGLTGKKTTRGFTLEVRVLAREQGQILFERQLELTQADCGAAATLVQVILDELGRSPRMAELVRALEQTKPQPEIRVVELERSVVGFGVLFSVGVVASPLGAHLDLGPRLEMGGKTHRFAVGLVGRFDSPTPLGSGEVYSGQALSLIGYRLQQADSIGLFELRTGVLWARGSGFSTDRTAFGFAFELLGGWLSSLGPVRLGPYVALSPLAPEVSSAGRVRGLPWLRIGLSLDWPLGQTFF